jgi:hypothetical protein
VAVETFETQSESAGRQAAASQPTDREEISSARSYRSDVIGDELQEFSYRPVPVVAVIGLVLALLSSLGIFVWLVMPLCLVAFVISALSLWVIRRSDGAYGGTMVASSGVILSLLFLASGIGLQVYMYQTEVPEGYQRVSFVRDISDKKVVVEDGQMRPPAEVAELEGKNVFLKGYIYQTKQTENLNSFLFVKDNASCCFGANPEIWDRLGVVMKDGKTINYHAGKVAVAGTFRINPDFDPNGQLEPLYIIEADQFTTRVSDF